MIFFAIYQCIIRTAIDYRRSTSITLRIYFAAIALITTCAAGSFGHVFVNSDWRKHYAVFNYLIDNDLLAGISREDAGWTLRYYLGWYIIPAMLAKASAIQYLDCAIGGWTSLGLYLFFELASSLVISNKWKCVLPFVFMIFSGADIVGTAITGFHKGPIYHLEWWAGWIEYSANFTDLTWAPQHTIAAWLGSALALSSAKNKGCLYIAPISMAALFFWSPFVAIGAAPSFIFAIAMNYRSLNAIAVLMAAMMLAILCALVSYLNTDTDAMPYKFIWNSRCLKAGPCFSVSSYFLFVTIEFIPILALNLYISRGRDAMLWLCALLLLSLPAVTLGAANDINMHGSIPAICVLAISTWVLLGRAKALMASIAIGVLIIGSVTPIEEARRTFTLERDLSSTMTMSAFVQAAPQYKSQYFSSRRPWIVRERPL